jgi:hypothetical protein
MYLVVRFVKEEIRSSGLEGLERSDYAGETRSNLPDRQHCCNLLNICLKIKLHLITILI